MDRIAWQERISTDADIHHGTACVKGTRIPVSILLGSLADSMSLPEIFEAYPQLSPRDMEAVFAYAAEIVQEETLLPLT